MPTEHTHNNSQEQKLASHIEQFNELTRQLDKAEKSNKQNDITQAQDSLSLFFGKLEIEKQNDIRLFLEKQKAGQTIDEYRRSFRGKIHKTMDSIVGSARAAADTVPKLAQETSRFIVATIGGTVVGLGKGVMDSYRAAKQAV